MHKVMSVERQISWREALFARAQHGERLTSFAGAMCGGVGASMIVSGIWNSRAADVAIGAALLALGIAQTVLRARKRRRGHFGSTQRPISN